jgi:hypothetical protein
MFLGFEMLLEGRSYRGKVIVGNGLVESFNANPRSTQLIDEGDTAPLV